MFVFSNFIICSNSQIAQRIAYNPNRHLACRCVTYDGDIYEQGTLSGGYVNQTAMILPQYGELCHIDESIKKQRAGFEVQKQKYEAYQKAVNEFRNKQKELDSRISRRDKIKNKLMNISLNLKKRDFKKQMADIQTKVKQLESERADHQSKIVAFK